jgi:hypothetical protein
MPLHHEEVLATKDRVAQPSPWVTSFFLPHDSLGVGERRFGQVVIQLHRLTGPIYEHVIGTFNICSRGPTRRSLTDTSRGYNFGGADFPHKTLWPSQTMVSAFYLRAPPDLRLSILIHPIITNWTKEGTNPKSHEWEPPLDFYCNLSSKHSIANGKPPRDRVNNGNQEGYS